jgi:hypothetical protein
MRLRELFPGQFEFRFKFDPGVERLILVPTHPVRWLHYVPSVLWHIQNLELKSSGADIPVHQRSVRTAVPSFTRRRAS